MEEDVKTLGDYISIAWRRKFYILIPFFVVLFITIITILILPPVYQSVGKIAIESQQIPQELIQSTVTTFADERVQVIKQRIMTGEQLFAIIEKFDLYSGEFQSRSRSEIIEDMRNRISIELVAANVRERWGAPSATIAFTISFEHGNAEATQKVANELVTLFLDENIRTRTERAEETSEFFKKESERLGAEIALIEERIAAYKQENEGSLPENLRLNLEQVAALKAAVLTAETNMSSLLERRKLLLIDLETLELETAANDGLTDEQLEQKQELKELQNRYISLSARYGAGHPDVKAIKRQISAFEKEYGNIADIKELKEQEMKVKQEILELTERYSGDHPDVKRLDRKLGSITTMITEFENADREAEQSIPNPKKLQIKARLESVDSNIARANQANIDLQTRINELDVRISRTPQVERGLDALERDYENTREKYQEMKAKQLQAELSKSLEAEQKGERFTLLEPPVLPDRPVKPDRKKLLLLGFLLSMVSGIGVAGLAEAFDGGIRGSRALASVTKMTPLVTIPYIANRRDETIKKRNTKILIVALILLGIVFLVLVHNLYKPLDELWYILLRKTNLT